MLSNVDNYNADYILDLRSGLVSGTSQLSIT